MTKNDKLRNEPITAGTVLDYIVDNPLFCLEVGSDHTSVYIYGLDAARKYKGEEIQFIDKNILEKEVAEWEFKYRSKAPRETVINIRLKEE